MSNPTDSPSQRVAIVGPGRLGFTLALRYAQLGTEVQLVGRREGPWLTRAKAAGLDTHVAPTAREIPSFAGLELLLFCVPDDGLQDCVHAWADACKALAPPRLVVHTCGAADLELLRPWNRSLHAALHPMRVIAGLAAQGDPGSDSECIDELKSAPITVLANHAQASKLACAEVAAWGAEAIAFDSLADRRRYHLACCLAANHLTALMAWAEELAGPALGDAAARRSLGSLAASALQRVMDRGPARALTGPVSRGDAVTLQAHLDALSVQEAERYRALLPELIGMARTTGRLTDERARELECQLGLAATKREESE
jgi:predicted short-subunit dehydrogenase-like oxidoreductase (DUF2520 family)